MDFEKLVTPFADYLGFFFSFWSGDFHVVEELVGLNEISTNALLLALVGIGAYLVLRYAKLGIVAADPDDGAVNGPALETNSLTLFLLTTMTSPLVFELSAHLTGLVDEPGYGGLFSTLNAGFLSVAALYPFNGISSRLNAFSNQMLKIGGKPYWVAVSMNIVANLATLALMVYVTRTILIVHQVTLRQAWPTYLVALVAFTSGMAVVFWFLWHWNKFIAEKTKK